MGGGGVVPVGVGVGVGDGPAIAVATSWRIDGRSAYSIVPGQSVAAQSRWPEMFGSNFWTPVMGLVYVELACGSRPWWSASQASRLTSELLAAGEMSTVSYVPRMATPMF